MMDMVQASVGIIAYVLTKNYGYSMEVMANVMIKHDGHGGGQR